MTFIAESCWGGTLREPPFFADSSFPFPDFGIERQMMQSRSDGLSVSSDFPKDDLMI
jgi:hypothetical protein